MYDVIPFICFELTELTLFFTIFFVDIPELFSATLFCLEVYLRRLSYVNMVLTYNCGCFLVITVLLTYLGGANAISLDLEELS